MSPDNATRPAAYSAASKWIHWIVAVALFFTISIGIRLRFIPEGPTQDYYFDVHRSLGVLVLALAVLRVSARSAFGAPAPAATLTRLERVASTAAHHSLLLLLFLQPIVGWLSMDAYRADVSVFGLFTLPHLFPQSDAAYAALSWVHFGLGYLMLLVICAHVAGALMHGFVKRDGVLNRMLPRFMALPYK
jgi:cytochrome b561